MPRDYAKQSRPEPAPRRTPRKAAPAKRSGRPQPARHQSGGLSVRWILSLAAVGGFIGFIFYLNTLEPGTPSAQPADNDRQSQPEAISTNRNQRAPAEQPQNFRFYEMLPDSEVIPPKVEEYTPGPAQQTYNYLVQTGSFRSQSDAERQRAQIAFQGLRAKVSRIDLNSGSTWYRVNVGPFTTRSQMNSALDKLVAINIQPLVRKIPKDG
ncbi:SPOR domain-containing protein [Marinobacter sp. SS21]|uniref:SPOR domain-containing protein n=1 Tax=Marinobacter sp. SS21 TaxID=2979460 RepID=UPI002330BAA8|nr:SPOR domain-containing protein [Marinobacter sp. SS21]MDC0663076.1 SPOR domain-containing protein [Marinobacter sp. SS21]